MRQMVLDYDIGHEESVRTAAFAWLAPRVSGEERVIDRTELAEGFRYQGERVPLVSAQGIFKPRILGLPLSITTSPNGPYDDRMGGRELLRYKYRGTDP